MASDPNCIFCKIVAGEIPSFKLYEDDETLAFMDINPVHDGHCLVVPKAHYPNVFEIAPAAMAAVAQAAARVATAVNQAVKPDGLNLIQANAGVSRPPLHQQHAASGDSRQERLGRSNLLARSTQVGGFVDHQLVGAHLVESATRYGSAGGVHPVDDELITGHGVLYLTEGKAPSSG